MDEYESVGENRSSEICGYRYASGITRRVDPCLLIQVILLGESASRPTGLHGDPASCRCTPSGLWATRHHGPTRRLGPTRLGIPSSLAPRVRLGLGLRLDALFYELVESSH